MTNAVNDHQFEKDSEVILKYVRKPNATLKSKVKEVIEKNLNIEEHIKSVLSYSGIGTTYPPYGETSYDATKYILHLVLDTGFDSTKFLQLIVYSRHYSYYQISTDSKIELIRIAVEKGAKLDAIDFGNKKIDIEILKTLIALDKDLELKITTLNLRYIDTLYSLSEKYFKRDPEFFIEKFLFIYYSYDNVLNPDPNTFLEVVLGLDPGVYENDNYIISPQKLAFQRKLIKLAQDRGADLNNIIKISNYFYGLTNVSLSAHKEQLMNHPARPLSADNLLRMAMKLSTISYFRTQQERSAYEENIKYAIDKGADLNIKLDPADGDDESNLTILESLFTSYQLGDFELINSLPKSDRKIGTYAWIKGIFDNPGVEFIAEAIKHFPHSFSPQSVYELAKAHGVSNSKIKGIIDKYNLAKDYKDLSDQEIALLSNTTQELLPVENYKNIDLQNKYGFTVLQLALLGKKFDLATQMLEHGHSVTEKNNNGLTALALVKDLSDGCSVECSTVEKIQTLILKQIDEVDIILSEDGESLVDRFIGRSDFREEILARSNDPLFALFKQDADLFEPSKNPEVTHIAISHVDGFWSTSLWGWSRLASKEHANTKFHLVGLKMIEQGGDEFIKQFDGWMNPGGGVDYPKKPEFTIDDWKTTMVYDWKTTKVLLNTYQKTLEKTFEFKIPSIGMCAGAENLALHHKAYIQTVIEYNKGGNHKMLYVEGTLPHFMAMTKEQQQIALERCEFPEIFFRGDTAHNYAAVTYKLGNGLQLGAISEDGVAMSFGHQNGLSYATQFHPEYHYHLAKDSVINHEKAWLDNFVDLANLHHDFRIGIHEHPEVFFQQISGRLGQCMELPTCLMGNHSIFSNATIADSMFGD